MKKFILHLCILVALVFLTPCCLIPIFLFAQAGWSEDVRLTYFDGFSLYPRAACCGDTIHLVWWAGYTDTLGIHEEVFYKRSIDAGLTWEDKVRLTPEDSISGVIPSIAVWEENVHVVWQEESAYYLAICYSRSEDGGETWNSIDTIFKTHNEDGWYHPWICAHGNNIYLVTIGCAGGGQLVFTKSTDNGNSWVDSQNITVAKSNPLIRVSEHDSLFLAVVYSNTPEIYCVVSFDAGETWGDSQCVSEGINSGSQRPAMDTDDNGGIHVTWYDYKYSPYPWTGDIFYRRSDEQGSWSEIDSLTTLHRAVTSDILAERNNLHLVWEDDRHDFNDNFEIYYRMSTNSGQTWLPEVRLTDTLNWSRFPSLACDGQYLHLFWSDSRDDSNSILEEIYYKRKDLSSAIFESTQQPLISTLEFNVFPNPFHQMLTIEFSVPIRNKDIGIIIYDVSGKKVIIYEVTGISGGLAVNTGDLPCGVYFIELNAEATSVTRKAVKIK